jgi:hypothetical protein
MFDPCEYAGVLDIQLTTTKSPKLVEKRVLESLSEIKEGINARELRRLKERVELARRREWRDDALVLDNMAMRNRVGVAYPDLDVFRVTADDLKEAAHRYLPAYQGGYVRMARVSRNAKAS